MHQVEEDIGADRTGCTVRLAGKAAVVDIVLEEHRNSLVEPVRVGTRSHQYRARRQHQDMRPHAEGDSEGNRGRWVHVPVDRGKKTETSYVDVRYYDQKEKKHAAKTVHQQDKTG